VRIRVGTGAEGEVVLPPAEAEALGLAGGGGGELLTARGAFTLLLPARADQPGAWFAGSLAAISVPEVIQFLFTSLKTGVLLLAFGEGRGGASAPERLRRKSIYFRDGQIAFASSSDLADRLGRGPGALQPPGPERPAPRAGAGGRGRAHRRAAL
jgi:hypothetical protein